MTKQHTDLGSSYKSGMVGNTVANSHEASSAGHQFKTNGHQLVKLQDTGPEMRSWQVDQSKRVNSFIR